MLGEMAESPEADVASGMYTEEKLSPDDIEELQIIELRQEPLTKWRIILLNLSWFGLSLNFLIMSVVVVPSQIQELVGSSHKGRWLGGIVAAGALSTFICSPLVGMKSDRLTSKYGRRRPVMAIGTAIMCIGLIGLAFSAPHIKITHHADFEISDTTGTCDIDLVAARCLPYQNETLPSLDDIPAVKLPAQQGAILMPDQQAHKTPVDTDHAVAYHGSIAMYVVCYLIVITSFAAITVPYNALIADKSHPSQRGLSSGVMGAMILFGNVCGAAIGIGFIKIGVYSIYGCMIAVVIVCVTITIVTTPEVQGKEVLDPLSLKSIFIGFWKPLKQSDFRWVFITRFLMQQGVSTVTAFLEYWLADMVNLPNCWSPQTSVALMLLPLLFAAAFCSILCGVLSDRIGQRKPLVSAAAIFMCLTTCVLAFIRGQYAFFVAIPMAFIFGIGFGSFQAVDFALVMDVLPEERDKAKDIAVWHQALILPQALATPIGGLVVDVGESMNCELGLGYIILFSITSVYFLLSALFVTRIKGVR